MHIEHLAIWCNNLEKMKQFYCTYFNAKANNKYNNASKSFSSYFLSFEKGPRLELMQMPGIPQNINDPAQQYTGIIHFAISAGSKEEVNRLTEQLKADGFLVVGEPRITGDGYYESVILDPEGNRIEITA
ncbi:MAG TPA: VOC family protein [Chitinophagaceae bacterium]|nr:VOC family protein [Chitinophagaceae bacterium]